MEQTLLEIKDRCESGIASMKRIIESKDSTNIEKNRASYQINTLEMIKVLAENGLNKKDSIVSKAKKWDALDKKISMFYENEDSEGDLCDIGEVAASAFGYL